MTSLDSAEWHDLFVAIAGAAAALAGLPFVAVSGGRDPGTGGHARLAR
jgi:hypothetical protein